MNTIFYPVQNVDTTLEPTTFEPNTTFEPTIQYEPITSEPIRSQPIRSQPIRSQPICSQPIKSQPILSNTKQLDCLSCYSKKSSDARCCGLCFYCCPAKIYKDKFELCPINLYDYWISCYVQTNDGVRREEKDVCCFVCFPVKIVLFFPCLLGSLSNGFINCLRKTDLNYFF
jgi:hypothetical protein